MIWYATVEAMSSTGYAYAPWQGKKYCYTSIPEVKARLQMHCAKQGEGRSR
ncbi:hypothetical protein [Nostoc sp. CHAB 5715]|uniref:hypothetical protein n=1 Tax=Nostoc sp. CHAB 5715 TaxID=2780400 RepID=UPI001E59D291|nr:hypothetical protein [Nostoc sp. CHAB 5715]MCC5623786.1 hypothetical protein [Nostoc sp. CHAB 5715]